jgi:hypothetical protein
MCDLAWSKKQTQHTHFTGNKSIEKKSESKKTFLINN